MNTPPFKRGDRVALYRFEQITGTVFFVKRNTKDEYGYKGRRRGYVKIAKAGDWTIGVEWDNQEHLPYEQRKDAYKYQQHGWLVAITK